MGAVDSGDYVVVTNARHVMVTGKKAEQKLYRSHSGHPGGLKEIPYQRMMEQKPEEVRRASFSWPRSPHLNRIVLPQIIRKAVSGMLPKNTLRARRLERLRIFPDDDNPYTSNILHVKSQQISTAPSTPR